MSDTYGCSGECLLETIADLVRSVCLDTDSQYPHRAKHSLLEISRIFPRVRVRVRVRFRFGLGLG